MVLTLIRCPVLGGHVTRVIDFEGKVTKIICNELNARTGTCGLRKTAVAGGPLTQLLERVSEDTIARAGVTCVMR